jgi:2-polyprenyl-3-methyl-5-hydroxy-6-metoxy-1,4-benzoquinol methylase
LRDSPNYHFIKEYLNHHASKAARILDFGCGDGSLSAFLLSQGFNVSGVEIVERFSTWLQDIAYQEVRPRFKYGDYHGRIPFEDNSFDVIIANEVFEHIQHFPETIRELSRVLDRGGVVLASFMTSEGLIEGHTHIPLLHKLGRGRFRRVCLRWFAPPRAAGETPAEAVADWIEYLDHATFYRTRRCLLDAVSPHFSMRDITGDWLRIGGEYLARRRRGRKRILGRWVAALSRSGLFTSAFSRYYATFWQLSKI